jgi:hypothetical protein
MSDPYVLFANEIILVTLRDYERGERMERDSIRHWVADRPVTFRYCAQALVNGDSDRLTDIMHRAMGDIDAGITTHEGKRRVIKGR